MKPKSVILKKTSSTQYVIGVALHGGKGMQIGVANKNEKKNITKITFFGNHLFDITKSNGQSDESIAQAVQGCYNEFITSMLCEKESDLKVVSSV